MTDLKVGDEVEIYKEDWVWNHSKFKLGYRGKITKIDESTHYPGQYWIYIDGEGGIIDRLVKKVEKHQYKKGDKVWIKEWSYAKIEPQEGVIIDTREDLHQMIPISIKKDHHNEPGTWYFKLSEIEPMKEKQEYKVGQRVIVHSGANLSNYNGKSGIITRINPDREGYPNLQVKFDYNDAEIHVYKEKNTMFNVEIINENKTKSMQLTKENAKVGMKVKILKGHFGYETGDIGIIKKLYNDSGKVFVENRISRSAVAPNVIFSFSSLEIAEEEKTYPDKFYVTGGTPALKGAFLKELEEAGFKCITAWERSSTIYPRNLETRLKGEDLNELYDSSMDEGEGTNYILPQDYNEALEAFKNILKVPAKPQEITVKIIKGSKELNAIVTKDTVALEGYNFKKHNIEELRKVLSYFDSIPNIGSWDIVPNTCDIGCQAKYDVQGLRDIVKAWDSLQ